MKKHSSKFLFGLLFLFLIGSAFSQNNGKFAWMKGPTSGNDLGFYGAMGVPSPSNNPGCRKGAHTWMDLMGNLWLFGGGNNMLSSYNVTLCNDLWKYNPLTNGWVWIRGYYVAQPGVYGTIGIPSTNNIPGARTGGMTWTDGQGDFWLYGGWGLDVNGNNGWLSDLWKYDVATNMWTWVNGQNSANSSVIFGTQGISAPGNNPGARKWAATWADNAGNLWLYGGNSANASSFNILYNDLWKYNISNNQWTWIHGSNTPGTAALYGTQGVASIANTPGTRETSTSWIDNSGNLWLFGDFWKNDLWKYDVNTNQWTWMSGSDYYYNSPATFNPKVLSNFCVQGMSNGQVGARYMPATWKDLSGNFWLYGGGGYTDDYTWQGPSDELDDLWRFDPSLNKWDWVKGSKLHLQPGTYGVQTVHAVANSPGGRWGMASWTDQSGNFWLFGGSAGFSGLLSDLWKFDNGCPRPIVTNTGTNCILCGGQSYTIEAQGATSYTWSNGLTTPSIALTPSGTQNFTLSYTNMDGCSDQIPFTISYTPSPMVNISSVPNNVCGATPVTLNASGADSYVWNTAQTVAVITVTPQVTTGYSVVGINTNGCYGNAVKNIQVFQLPNLSASASQTKICSGEEVTLTASGANTYTWNNLAQSGQNYTVAPSVTSAFFVTGSDLNGCKSKATLTITVLPCTGIDDRLSFEEGFSIYPNPNSGRFKISNGKEYKGSLLLYNSLGEKVLERELLSPLLEIETTLPEGVYILNIVSSGRKLSSGKIVIAN